MTFPALPAYNPALVNTSSEIQTATGHFFIKAFYQHSSSQCCCLFADKSTAQLHSTNPGSIITTSLSEQDQTPSPSWSPPHNFTWIKLGLLMALLPLKYKEAEESPFETHFVTIVAFVLTILIYGMIWHPENTLETRNPDIVEVIGYCSRLRRFLAVVLLLLMLVPILGWITFGIWVCCFVMVLYLLYIKFSGKVLRDQSTIPMSNQENSLGVVVEQK